MSIQAYADTLAAIQTRFFQYRGGFPALAENIRRQICRSVLTKGRIFNFTPYAAERLGSRLNGKFIPAPIFSDDCMRYHFDSQDRVVMVETFSRFLNKFQLETLYRYHEDGTVEELLLSSELPSRLSVRYMAGERCVRLLSYAHLVKGFIAEDFLYNGVRLREVQISRAEGDYTDAFTYGSGKLSLIVKTYPNGGTRVVYTTRKPNFKAIRQEVSAALKAHIAARQAPFTAIGIEGFLDQAPPHFALCFETAEAPKDLLADWNCAMEAISVYDFPFSDAQFRRCVKIMAELLVELVQDGTLKDTVICFHQNQVPAASFDAGARAVFRKAGLKVL